jgi:hypothetical protein
MSDLQDANKGYMSKPQPEMLSRFLGPTPHSSLNSIQHFSKFLHSSQAIFDLPTDSENEQDQQQMMQGYFDSVRSRVHRNLDNSRESDCFLPEFSLPDSYSLPQLKQNPR